MSQPLPSYLRTFRRTWALSQQELADLVGKMSKSTLSKFETLERMPDLEAALGFEVVFDASAEDLFPALFLAAQRRVFGNAVALKATLVNERDPQSVRKRQLLDALIINLSSLHDKSQ